MCISKHQRPLRLWSFFSSAALVAGGRSPRSGWPVKSHTGFTAPAGRRNVLGSERSLARRGEAWLPEHGTRQGLDCTSFRFSFRLFCLPFRSGRMAAPFSFLIVWSRSLTFASSWLKFSTFFPGIKNASTTWRKVAFAGEGKFDSTLQQSRFVKIRPYNPAFGADQDMPRCCCINTGISGMCCDSK